MNKFDKIYNNLIMEFTSPVYDMLNKVEVWFNKKIKELGLEHQWYQLYDNHWADNVQAITVLHGAGFDYQDDWIDRFDQLPIKQQKEKFEQAFKKAYKEVKR